MRHRPSPSLVISILALVMATSGTAIAAKVLITSSAQIKANSVNSGDIADGTVAARDLKANSVDGDKVKNGSLALDDLTSAARGSLTEAGTQAIEGFRKSGPNAVEADKVTRVATLSNVPPGTYAIFAKTILTPLENTSGLVNQGKTVSGHCVLDAGGDKDEARQLIATPGSLAPGELNTQITRTFGSTGVVTLDCDMTGSRWNGTDTSIIAVRVGAAPRSPVEG